MLEGSETCFGIGLDPKITQLEVKNVRNFSIQFSMFNFEFTPNLQIPNLLIPAFWIPNFQIPTFQILKFQIQNIKFQIFK